MPVLRPVLCALVAARLAAVGPCAMAASFTFAGFTFDQDRATDTLSLLGAGVTLGGAQFSAGYATTTTTAVGFLAHGGNATIGYAPQAGFDASRTLGRQGLVNGMAAPNASSWQYASGIQLPRSNNGGNTSTGLPQRHGIEMSWANRVLANRAGADFLIYESASNALDNEAFMVRARDASTGEWSRWFYKAADSFEAFSETPDLNGPDGAHAYAFDMSDLGFAAGALVDAIQLANMRITDRIEGDDGTEGFVVFNGAGRFAQYLNGQTLSTYASVNFDPDPLYAVALSDLVGPGQAVPLPTAGAMGLAGLVALGLRRGRRRRFA